MTDEKLNAIRKHEDAEIVRYLEAISEIIATKCQRCDSVLGCLGCTPLMIATFNSQLYNMAVLHFFNAQLGATCSSYELDVFDIAEITKISNTMEVLKDF